MKALEHCNSSEGRSQGKPTEFGEMDEPEIGARHTKWEQVGRIRGEDTRWGYAMKKRREQAVKTRGHAEQTDGEASVPVRAIGIDLNL